MRKNDRLLTCGAKTTTASPRLIAKKVVRNAHARTKKRARTHERKVKKPQRSKRKR